MHQQFKVALVLSTSDIQDAINAVVNNDKGIDLHFTIAPMGGDYAYLIITYFVKDENDKY